MPFPLSTNSATADQTREARRILTSLVRSDWSYPPLPEYAALDSGATTIPEPSPALTNDETVPVVADTGSEVREWREREYSSDEEDVVPRGTGKRKRAQLNQEEMEWNAGLAHWAARRDAWVCARAKEPKRPKGRGLADVLAETQMEEDTETETEVDEDEGEGEGEGVDNIVLPVPPPMLPDHPVRKKISSSMYGEIYSKIILQSRTPTVPINLVDVIRALIHGWKEEGNWPPKGTIAEPPIGKRKNGIGEAVGTKHPHFKRGVQAVGRVFGLGGTNGQT